ncbi:MAG: nucleoside deaminase [Buchnera aphidicola (Pentalonia nigronervosa)]|jgi:tRNA(adenine34) deaminase|uniref:tRNA-specific adenosine deaminase n=1 Tax=Buchnera aphidicola (Pentalonia nigronervosa) TaxID=1309793 RepID=A0A7H1AZQ0_9GAMM|nr:MAG: nucleoside deaminase [Buchnera aphidicola (Pentalonia nigronervosa)]
MIYKQDTNWMKIALKYAYYARKQGEIPIGAIVLLKENIIGVGWNSSINQHDPTAHAEIIALRNAAKKIKNYRLLDTTLYVTLQPCTMCWGAIIHSRIKRLVFGANSKKIDDQFLNKNVLYNKKINLKITKNIMQKQCSKILTNFFQKKRNTSFLK